MLGFFNIHERIKEVTPFEVSNFVIEEIALQSSYIPFHGQGEVLFKKGDPALGFYWILRGEAEVLIPDRSNITLGPGSMAGLDSFIEDENLPFDILNKSKHLDCLFIDRRCYKSMQEHQEFNRHMNYMVLNCLKNYRNLLISNERMYL
ncbi:MAG: cyclic nucleotide-binding domain-containing protein [Croceimicrobium sp.]|nr:cyclic nucleotide-binding domain-containing protein [Bacteroidota bacterium]